MKKSTQVALGGLCASLCLVCMFMTAIIPFSAFAMPALAGFILIAVASENGFQTSVLVYIAVAVLSVFIVPDKQSVLLFVLFFGYYPTLRPRLQKIHPFFLQYGLKLVIYNAAILLFYYGTLYVFGMPDLLTDFGNFGKYTAVVAIGMANLIFVIYDNALKNITSIYTAWFRPKILKKMR